jgi:hypothetical protein
LVKLEIEFKLLIFIALIKEGSILKIAKKEKRNFPSLKMFSLRSKDTTRKSILPWKKSKGGKHLELILN